MGNRAVLTFSTASTAPAIYLHWNGGRASVEGFLQAAKAIGIRHAGSAHAKTMDALAETIARHFFGCHVGITVYRFPYDQTDRDNGDNGVYILAEDMTIKSRKHRPADGEERNPKKTIEIFEHITARAPIFNN